MHKLKMAAVVLTVGLALGWAGTAGAGTVKATGKPAAAIAAQTDWAICPVEKTKILKSQAVGTTVYQGKTYYFCCAGCKPAFLKNPGKYVK
jgi:YHS domain-containing protein